MTGRRRRRRSFQEDPEWTETVGGVEIRCTFRIGVGVFQARYGGDLVSVETHKELLGALNKLVEKARVRVELPITVIDDYGGSEDMTVTGRHTGTSNLLVVDETGRRRQLLVGGRTTIVRRLSVLERAEWKNLSEAKRRADKAVDAFVTRRDLGNGDAALDDAIAAKVDLPTENEDGGR